MAQTIKSTATAAAADLDKRAGRATARRLDQDDIEQAIRAHLLAAKQARARDFDETVRTTVHGGHVASTYQYVATSDRLDIFGDFARSLSFVAIRGQAQKRPHGVGPWLLVRVRKPGQTQGRVVFSQ